MPTALLVVLWGVLSFSAQTPSPAAAPTSASARLVTSTGLRVRAAPRADAAVVDKISIGAVIRCLERSPPVSVGGVSGAFCRVRVGDQEGYIFEPLTAPLEGDRLAQEERLIAQKLAEGGWTDQARWPDLYELHGWLLKRVDAAEGKERTMRARFLELSLVAATAEAFHADPRVYRDEAQGLRVRVDALRALEREAQGTTTAEAAAWLLVEIGKPFECEGYLPCVLSALLDIECGYLTRHPRGAHADAALQKVHETLAWAAAFAPQSEQPVDDTLDHLARVEASLRALPKAQGAAALAQAARLRTTLHKAKPPAPPPTP